jgi:hypothetical protein
MSSDRTAEAIANLEKNLARAQEKLANVLAIKVNEQNREEIRQRKSYLAGIITEAKANIQLLMPSVVKASAEATTKIKKIPDHTVWPLWSRSKDQILEEYLAKLNTVASSHDLTSVEMARIQLGKFEVPELASEYGAWYNDKNNHVGKPTWEDAQEWMTTHIVNDHQASLRTAQFLALRYKDGDDLEQYHIKFNRSAKLAKMTDKVALLQVYKSTFQEGRLKTALDQHLLVYRTHAALDLPQLMAFMLEAWAQVGQQPSVDAALKENAAVVTASTTINREAGKALNLGRVFQGTCHNCHAQGHKAAECPARSRQPLQVVTQGTLGTTRSAPDLSNIICHKCNNKGHYANRCPQSRSLSAAPLRLNHIQNNRDYKRDGQDGLEHEGRYNHKKVRFNNEAVDEKSQE